MGAAQIVIEGGGPRLAGTRLTVFDVIPYWEEGWNASSIALAFGISSDQAQALISYIEEHRDEVMAENQKILDRIARGNPPEVEAKLRQSRAKLFALRDEIARKSKGGPNGAGHPE